MYQTLVLALCLLLVAGSAYFIKRTDRDGALTGPFHATTTTAAPATAESIPGTYACDSSSGCENPRLLALMENGEAKLSASFDNGVEFTEEFGTWTIADDGMLRILLTGTSREQYETPRTLLISRATKESLGGIGFDTTFYADWKNPSFVRDSRD